MTNTNEVRDAQGKIIAIINRRALNAWLHFGTTEPSFPTLAANVRHTPHTFLKEQQRVSLPATTNNRKNNGTR